MRCAALRYAAVHCGALRCTVVRYALFCLRCLCLVLIPFHYYYYVFECTSLWYCNKYKNHSNVTSSQLSVSCLDRMSRATWRCHMTHITTGIAKLEHPIWLPQTISHRVFFSIYGMNVCSSEGSLKILWEPCGDAEKWILGPSAVVHRYVIIWLSNHLYLAHRVKIRPDDNPLRTH